MAMTLDEIISAPPQAEKKRSGARSIEDITGQGGNQRGVPGPDRVISADGRDITYGDGPAIPQLGWGTSKSGPKVNDRNVHQDSDFHPIDATKAVAKALVNDPFGTVKGGYQAMISGMIDMETMATQGLATIGKAAANMYHGQGASTATMNATDSVKAASDTYASSIKASLMAAMGFKNAPEDKKDDAMANFLSQVPNGIHAAGNNVYEKTGSALAGAGTEAVLTWLTFDSGTAGKGMGAVVRAVKSKAPKELAGVEVTPDSNGIYSGKRPDGSTWATADETVAKKETAEAARRNHAAGDKTLAAFDDLVVTNPDGARALTSHIEGDPRNTAVGKVLRSRIQKYINASDAEMTDIAKRNFEARIAEGPQSLTELIGGLEKRSDPGYPRGEDRPKVARATGKTTSDAALMPKAPAADPMLTPGGSARETRTFESGGYGEDDGQGSVDA